ncbi:MAG: hypothetical protein ACOYLB_12625 [Phototrophicaceae bacterium]
MLIQLQEHALEFHRALIESHTYLRPMSEMDFASNVTHEIDNLYGQIEEGVFSLDNALLRLPALLLQTTLAHAVPLSLWNYAHGYPRMFEATEWMFQQISIPFHWAARTHGKHVDYSYGIGESTWQLYSKALGEEVDALDVNALTQHLAEWLQPQGLMVYTVASGTENSMLMILRSDALYLLGDYLFLLGDPRAEALYHHE